MAQGQTMRWMILAVAAGSIALSGCNDLSDEPVFDGQRFRTKVSDIDDNRAAFRVRVREPGKSLDGAREAGRYAATGYCISNFGSSDIAWRLSPDDPPENIVIIDGELVLEGLCPSR